MQFSVYIKKHTVESDHLRETEIDFKNFPSTDKEIKALVQQSCDVNDSLKLNNKLKAIQKH